MIATPAYFTPPASTVLPQRWYPLMQHPEQVRFYSSAARFKVCAAGRRSGKSEWAKRILVEKAIAFARSDGLFVAAAPTRDQAKRIFWEDLKALVPKSLRARAPLDGELVIVLKTGTRIAVVGLDKPQRVEGVPVDGIVVDEIAEVKETAWESTIRPALSTLGRPGWCIFIGRPKGRNHFYRLFKEAKNPRKDNWDSFHWVSADILDPEEIASAKEDLDPVMYDQEYNASFVTLEGRAYYCFDHAIHTRCALRYFPERPLLFAFDFNVKPGIAVVAQDQSIELYQDEDWARELMLAKAQKDTPHVPGEFTAVIGEVYITRDSNTEMVCRKLVEDWGNHEGRVICYGDATGGAKGSAKVRGSNWDIIRDELGLAFGRNVQLAVQHANPPQRARVNALNARLRNAKSEVQMLLDPTFAPHTIDDIDSTTIVPGSAGEIDKDDEWLTHLSDAISYLVHRRYGRGRTTQTEGVTPL